MSRRPSIPSQSYSVSARTGGITFAMVLPSAEAGGKGASGTIIAGQGAIAQLNGNIDPKTHAFVRRRGRRCEQPVRRQPRRRIHAP